MQVLLWKLLFLICGQSFKISRRYNIHIDYLKNNLTTASWDNESLYFLDNNFNVDINHGLWFCDDVLLVDNNQHNSWKKKKVKLNFNLT
jgi:hypothetical protein